MQRLTRRQFLRDATLALVALSAFACRPSASVAPAGTSQTPATTSENRFAALEKEVQSVMSDHHMPGLAVGLIRDNQLVYARGFGVRDIRSGAPMTEKSVMAVMSISKTVTAAAVMQLVERGKVNLDHPYVEYVPYFKMADPRYKDITIRHLLGHNAGMPLSSGDELFREVLQNPSDGPDAAKELVESLADVELMREPGSPGFFWSDTGYDILAELVHLVSGELFEDYVKRHLLQPLKMKDSTFLYREVDRRKLVAPHIYDSKGNIVVWDHYPYDRKHAPSLELFTSIVDLSRWLLMHPNGGALQGKRVLQESSQAFMWEPLTKSLDSMYSFSSGWLMGEIDHRLWIVTGGSGPGIRTEAVLVPQEGLASIAFSNLYDTSIHFDSYNPHTLCEWALYQMLDGAF